ncbi:MAG: MtrB/PioB family outer membrane beta-barrel protein [Oligoflexia bacterium]|nr:MtrB/PioB family outer membrane beta-barrel protein [Oligoflexia bacterium]
MRKNKYVIIITVSLVFCLITTSWAWAQFSEFTQNTHGKIGLSGQSLKVPENSSKFQEYSENKSGVTGGWDARYDINGYYYNFIGKNVLLDNQYYEFNGGKFENFKFGAKYDKIIHNLSLGSKTFYDNPGSSTLTYTGTAADRTNTAAWNIFDYKLKKDNLSANMEWTFFKALTVSLDAKNTTTKGQIPAAYALSTTTSNATFAEIPGPINHETTDVNLLLSYSGKNFNVTANGAISKFNNKDDYLTFKTYMDNVTDKASLPPDNKYTQYGLKGTILHLPFESSVSLSYYTSELTNDVNMWNSVIYNKVSTTINSSAPIFTGKVVDDAVKLLVSSEPLDNLFVKAHYKYSRDRNKSSEVIFSTAGTTTTLKNERFEYAKYQTGVDAEYALPAKTKIASGFEYEGVKRDLRAYNGGNRDRSFYVEAKNKYFNRVNARVKYKHLTRTDMFIGEGVTTSLLYARKFDTADQQQDLFSTNWSFYLLDNLDLGLGYRHKSQNFPSTALGVQKISSNAANFDFSYSLFSGMVNLNGFADYEKYANTSNHRFTSGRASVNPDTTPIYIGSATGYNWLAVINDYTFTYGLDTTVQIIEETLQGVVGFSRQKSNGDISFFPQQNFISVQSIASWDDYWQDEFETKLIYNFLKNFEAVLGFRYQHLKYSDSAVDGYLLTPTIQTSKNPVFTGAYNDFPYNARVVYLTASYKF